MEAKSLDCFVIDAGAHTIRAGRAEDFPDENESPHIVIPSRVRSDIDTGGLYVPETDWTEVFDSRGCINDWEALEGIIEYLLYEQLGWPEGDEGYVLCTENVPCMCRSDRERLTQLLFETFNVKGCYLVDSSVASLYAAGKTNGIVVDLGHTGTNVVQVADGAVVVGTAERYVIGGGLLDSCLEHLLHERGLKIGKYQVQLLKEKCAAIADTQENFAELLANLKSVPSSQENAAENSKATSDVANDSGLPKDEKGKITSHELPDGQVVSIGSEGLLIGEALMQPSVLPDCMQQFGPLIGAADAAFSCAMNSTTDGRQSLLDNILVCGGCAMIAQFQQRFMSEMQGLLSSTANVGKLTIPDYMPKRTHQYAAYIGAAIIAKTISANHMLSKEEYEDKGPGSMHKKC